MNLTKFSTQKNNSTMLQTSCQAQLALRQMAKEAAAELEDPDHAYAEETEDAEGGGGKKNKRERPRPGQRPGKRWKR